MIIIVHKITKENRILSNTLNRYSIQTITRPWWVREGASRVRYWTYRERFLNES